jgi:hypothetical protein
VHSAAANLLPTHGKQAASACHQLWTNPNLGSHHQAYRFSPVRNSPLPPCAKYWAKWFQNGRLGKKMEDWRKKMQV